MPKRNTSGPSRRKGTSSSSGKSFGKGRSRSGGEAPSGRSKPGRSFSRERSGDDAGSKRPKPFASRRGESSGDQKRGGPFPRRTEGTGTPKPYKKSSEKFNKDDARPRSFSKPGRFNSGKEEGTTGASRPFRKNTGSFNRDDKRGSGFSKSPSRFKSDRDKGTSGEARPYRKSTGSFDEKRGSSSAKPRAVRDSRNDREKGAPRSGSFDKGPGKSSRPYRDKDGNSARSSAPSTSKPRRSATDSSTPKKPRSKAPFKRDEPVSDAPLQDGKIRLNKFISNSGVCSRREADELIKMGLISVNGKTITELGYKVNPGDEVRHESKVLHAEKPVYILLNKPKGFLTTTNDPQERNTVMQIVANAVKERIYPVGRLDRNTTGLLLLTNDGDLADKLMHPSYNIKKIYKVELDRPLTKADYQKILEGVHLEEGKAMVDDLAIVSDDGKTVGIEIHIGWNRVVRRIFEALEYTVLKLDRSVYAGLDKKDLPRGHWRFLSQEEIVRLKHYR